MKHNHNLLVKYLEIIQEQEKLINQLNKENSILKNRNMELKKHNEIYKQNTFFWKTQYDIFKSCVTTQNNKNEKQALNIYAKIQGY